MTMLDYLKALTFPLNIQLFGEDGGDGGADGSNGADDDISFDELLTDPVYKAEFDRRVSKAIKTFNANQSKKGAALDGQAQGGKASGTEEPSNPSQPNIWQQKAIAAEVQLALVGRGITDKAKLARVSRLISSDLVVDANGAIDAEALDGEIDNLMAEFPEFAPTKEDNEKQAGGVKKVGSSGEDNPDAAQKEQLDSIFTSMYK